MLAGKKTLRGDETGREEGIGGLREEKRESWRRKGLVQESKKGT